MLNLYIIRHANAEAGTHDQRDYDRELSEKGIIHAHQTAKSLEMRIVKPVKIICSPARRTYQTAQIIANKLTYSLCDLVLIDKIYESSLKTLQNLVTKFDIKNRNIIMIGHNPGLSALCKYYINHQHPLATAEVACIQFDVDDWAAVCRGSGNLFFTIDPRQHQSHLGNNH